LTASFTRDSPQHKLNQLMHGYIADVSVSVEPRMGAYREIPADLNASSQAYYRFGK